MNQFEGAMSQGHFALRYKLFSCYNHGDYLGHSRDILVDLRKNGGKWRFVTARLCLAVLHKDHGQLYESF